MTVDHIAISTPGASGPIAPYSQGIRAGDFLYISGQIGLEPGTKELAATFEKQVINALNSDLAILNAAGLGPEHVIKATVYLNKNFNDFETLNNIWKTVFPDPKPARSTVAVSDLPRGALVEIDLIAYKKA